MMIASWNVNSVRVREQHVADWLQSHAPDALGLQELKCRGEDFPLKGFEKLATAAWFTDRRPTTAWLC